MRLGGSTPAEAVLLLTALVLGTVAATAPLGIASHQPANKAAVSGSTLEVMETQLQEGSTSEEVTLLTAVVKTSDPQDLVHQVTLECALWTNTKVVGNDQSEAIATVQVWVEVDGEPVSVAGDDDGKVVFCNRAHKVKLSGLENENHTIEQFLSSRSANGFNWVTVDAGSGVHEIVVKGILEAEVTGDGTATAAVGLRSLVIEPIQLANDATK